MVDTEELFRRLSAGASFNKQSVSKEFSHLVCLSVVSVIFASRSSLTIGRWRVRRRQAAHVGCFGLFW